MTLYLTDHTTEAMVAEAADCPHVHGIKLYPAGATTNSDSGVTALQSLYPVFDAMQRHDLPLLIHGEVTNDHVDIFDREKAFIDSALGPIVDAFPALRIVFEHITTADAVQFVQASGDNVAATVTAHLIYNRNDMLVEESDHTCSLPVLADKHQSALRQVVTSGHPRFFLGTDSAPHAREDKGVELWLRRLLHGSMPRWRFMPKSSMKKMRLTNWSAASINGPTFTGFRATPAQSD